MAHVRAKPGCLGPDEAPNGAGAAKTRSPWCDGSKTTTMMMAMTTTKANDHHDAQDMIEGRRDSPLCPKPVRTPELLVFYNLDKWD